MCLLRSRVFLSLSRVLKEMPIAVEAPKVFKTLIKGVLDRTGVSKSPVPLSQTGLRCRLLWYLLMDHKLSFSSRYLFCVTS